MKLKITKEGDKVKVKDEKGNEIEGIEMIEIFISENLIEGIIHFSDIDMDIAIEVKDENN